ncbi:MAG: gamma-glutamyl-gamma-aminobutyrate hydrolase family protein [Actinobacteria bacterium]|nr:gamma-glutamyl-gamma-aminobutyrate hydrolase family protein [Actinomycetota bacterium]
MGEARGWGKIPLMTHKSASEPVALVVTEHPSYLDAARRAGYETVRARLEQASGRAVRPTHYADVRRLDASQAVVLSGASAPYSAYEEGSFDRLAEAVRAYRGPVLGICAGMQLLAQFAGGRVTPMSAAGNAPEHGFLPLEVLDDSDLLRGLPESAIVFHDHHEEVTAVPDGFRVLARTNVCAVQALADPDRGWWGTQFHPERSDAAHPDGERVLANFFALV